MVTFSISPSNSASFYHTAEIRINKQAAEHACTCTDHGSACETEKERRRGISTRQKSLSLFAPTCSDSRLSF